MPLLISAVVSASVPLFALWLSLFVLLLLCRLLLPKKIRRKVPAYGKRALLLGGVGFLVGALFVFRLAQTENRYGVDPQRLTGWSGVLSGDSRRLDFGRTGYNIRCREASGNGFTVSVDCALFVAVKEGEKLRQGQPVTVKGRRRGDYFFAESVTPQGGLSGIWAVRAAVLDRLTETFFVEETSSGAFFEALFSGDRDDLNSVMSEIFRKSGCLHLIALSGMHLGILIGILRLFFSKLLPEKWLNALLIPLLAMYVILTGGAPSLKRAYTMFTVSAAAGFRGVRLPLTDVLCLTLIINGLLFPQEIFHPGMQLSFAAVFGIAFLSRRLQTALCRFLPKSAAAPFAVSYAAQIGVAPFLFAMNGINPVGILASVLASPLLGLFMYLRFVSSSAALVGIESLALSLALLSDVLCHWMVVLLSFFACVPTLPLFPFGILFFVPLAATVTAECGFGRLLRLFFLPKKSKIAL